jgi:hypothetical protein
VTWWQVRRVAPNRYEVRPRGSCLNGMIPSAAALLVAAGMAVRLVPLLLDLARAHAGAIALAIATVLLLAAATRTRP